MAQDGRRTGAAAKGAGARTNLDILDVTKFVLSIMVVAIHSKLGGNWRVSWTHPWVRLAVPLFFVIGAFLFFRKYDRLPGAERGPRLRRYAQRNLQLYGVWLVLLLVPTILYRGWYKHTPLMGLFYFFRALFFKSTFVGSWFLMASVVAVGIVATLSRRVPDWVLLVLSLVVFVLTCLSCSYRRLLFDIPGLKHRIRTYFFYLGVPQYNYHAALIWVMLGKLAADHEEHIRAQYARPLCRVLVSLLLVMGCILLCFELRAMRAYDWAHADDAMLGLLLPVACIFLILMNTTIHVPHAPVLREVSTITFCLHGTLAVHLLAYLKSMGVAHRDAIVFAVALAISWTVSALILCLEQRKGWSWLRRLH